MKNLIIIALLSVCLHSKAQIFHLMGDAQEMKNDCIQLTPDVRYSEGLAYHTTKLDLSRFFEIQFDIFLGDKDEGADGITFVIHDDERGFNAFGTWGECMGYGRWSKYSEYGNYISPSIAIEFDTYQNERQNDPECDHIAFLEGGTNHHEVYWNNQNVNFNIEDNKLHDFVFRWEPDVKLITVWLDGQKVWEERKDLIQDVFGGNTKAIWGFTASTGNKHNLQFFCLKKWAKNQSTTSDSDAKY
jgi:Bacterial lectin